VELFLQQWWIVVVWGVVVGVGGAVLRWWWCSFELRQREESVRIHQGYVICNFTYAYIIKKL